MLGKRIEIKVDDDTYTFLRKFGNKSEFIRDLIMDYRNDPEMLQVQLAKINEKLQKNDIKRIDLENQKQKIESQIKAVEEYNAYRPEGYESKVKILLDYEGDVSPADISFHADKLGISHTDFKRMLYNDGYYEKIFKKV